MRCLTLNELPPTPPGKIGWPWTEESKPLPEKMLDGQNWPKISIVTPSYNQGRFIEGTIRSVLLQGYPNLEYIIIDGVSTDNSVEIIKKYSQWITYWISEPDRGQSHAINKGFERACGEIFGWLNSDDFLLPGALSNVVTAYRENPSAVGWAGICYCIDPSSQILKTVTPKGLERDSLADWSYGGFFYQPSCFFSAWAWKELNGLDESLHYAMDLDLWLRLAALGRFISIQHPLSAAIIHGDAKTQAQRPEMHAETVFVQIKHGYREAAMRRLLPLLRGKPPDYLLRTVLKAKLKHTAHRMGVLGVLRKVLRKKKNQEDMQLLADKIKELGLAK